MLNFYTSSRKYSAIGNCAPGLVQGGFRPLAALAALLLLSACAGPVKKTEVVFYPPPPQTPRVQFLTSITLESDLGKQASGFRKYVVGDVEGGKSLARPNDIDHVKGRIYVADKTIKKIIIINLENGTFGYIDDYGSGALRDPTGVFITPDGLKYVADANREQIVVYDAADEFVRTYGAEGQFRPTSVAVNGDKVYVCDIRDNEIEVLDKDSGEEIDKIGGPGSGEGSFKRPTHLALDKDGNLYVTDILNFRVQKFDNEGDFVRVLGEIGTRPGAFARPKGIDVDRDGHLYAADSAFQLMLIFDTETGQPLLDFGKYGPAPGSTYMPAGVHIDYDNVGYFSKYADPDFKLEYLIYVGNLLGGHKLNVYGFGKWTGASLKGYRAPETAPAGERPETVPSLDAIPGATEPDENGGGEDNAMDAGSAGDSGPGI